jgi:ATP-dependent exoDNAse (exonuclease V) alpha subunit
MKNTTQEEALETIENNSNYFLTGGAGVGKSYVIKQFHDQTDKNVVLTATTGIAALNLGGETIHRFLGIGISTRPFELPKLFGLWDKIKRASTPWDKTRMAVIRSLDAIVIDEISMLRRDQFELIDAVLAHIKDNTLPFGGVKLLCIGDFCQLPPVITSDDLIKYKDLKSPYCFQSDLWEQSGIQTLNLTKNFRQSSGKFLEALGEIRVGKVSDEVNDMLLARMNAKLETDLTPVKLFSHNYRVEQENLEKLNQLPDEKINSHAIMIGKQFDIDALKRDCPAEETLSFCKGAQVMMINNDMDNKWVNGSMGIIEEVEPVVVRLGNDTKVQVDKYTWERINHKLQGDKLVESVVAKLIQYPFRLAWATSIHKSQGLTLDFVELDLSNAFAHGQGYTALSRVKTLEGLKLIGWDKKSVKADPKVLEFYGL